MTSDVTKVQSTVETASIPDGEYLGHWGAYAARFEVNGIQYEAETVVGIRTMNAPCVVRVKAGVVTVNT